MMRIVRSLSGSYLIIPLCGIIAFLMGTYSHEWRWRSGDPTSGYSFSPDRFFVVAYSTAREPFAYCKGLGLLQKDICEGAPDRPTQRRFRRDQGRTFAETPLNDDSVTWEQVTATVVSETPAEQIIETVYKGDRILKGWFRYRVRNEQIEPLASRVLSVFHLYFGFAWSIIAGIAALLVVHLVRKKRRTSTLKQAQA